jgi:hypothetical protein
MAKAHIAFGKVREKGESTILNDQAKMDDIKML